MKIAAWVQRLNKLGRQMDETAANMHPSAWPETLKGDREKWKKLARAKHD